MATKSVYVGPYEFLGILYATSNNTGYSFFQPVSGMMSFSAL